MVNYTDYIWLYCSCAWKMEWWQHDLRMSQFKILPEHVCPTWMCDFCWRRGFQTCRLRLLLVTSSCSSNSSCFRFHGCASRTAPRVRPLHFLGAALFVMRLLVAWNLAISKSFAPWKMLGLLLKHSQLPKWDLWAPILRTNGSDIFLPKLIFTSVREAADWSTVTCLVSWWTPNSGGQNAGRPAGSVYSQVLRWQVMAGRLI